MSLHVFANFVTLFGTAANNRAETEGNITTLQKLLWMGETHSTVSAEAIRFALRRRFSAVEETNRKWDELKLNNCWKEPDFNGWEEADGKTYIDDDLLGYMKTEATKEDGEAGSANVRRAVLEVTRAVSLTPWPGDVTFNAASPGATPSAQKKGSNPVPYGTELHATRYQYGIALTPERSAIRVVRRRLSMHSATSAPLLAITADSSSTSHRMPSSSGSHPIPLRAFSIASALRTTARLSLLNH